MNTRSMTRKRNEALLATIQITFDELRLARHTAPLSADTSTTTPSRPHKYLLRPRKPVSYYESDEFTYVDDAKDTDYIPHVHTRSIQQTQSQTSIQPILLSLPASNPSSLRTNITAFITEVQTSSLDDKLLYNTIGQYNNGVSHRWALRSLVKK